MPDFEPCKASSPGEIDDDPAPVLDYTRSHPYRPARIYTPADRRQLVAAIVDGEADGKRMKAVGGNYSLSAAQNADHYLIQTHRLGKFLSQPYPGRTSGGEELVLAAEHLRAGHAGSDLASLVRPGAALPPGTHLVHVEAGIGIRHLLARLAEIGLALPTMGSGGAQTLAGAISTGTHGSDFRIPPLGDHVRALHLVGPGGREWWIEPSHGVVGGAALTELPGWCAGTQVIRDDEIFRAALVSVGRLGVIYAVVLEVREQYWLEDRSERAPSWSSVRAQLRDGDALFERDHDGEPLRYLSAVIDLASGESCWLTRRWETRSRKEVLDRTPDRILCEDPGHYAGIVPAKTVFTSLELRALAVPVVGLAWAPRIMAFYFELVDLAHTSETMGDFLARVTRKVSDLPESEVGPDAYHAIRNIVRGMSTLVIDMQHKPLIRAASGLVLDQHNYAVDHCYSGDSTELFFDAGQRGYLDFIDDVIAEAQADRLIPGYISLRFVGRSQALLAMEQFERTVAIEIAVPKLADGTPLFEPFMSTVGGLGRKHGGLPHWGQRHARTAENIASLYPAAMEPFRWALAELQGEPARDTFSSEFTRARGLEPEAGKRLVDHRGPRSGGVLVAAMVPTML